MTERMESMSSSIKARYNSNQQLEAIARADIVIVDDVSRNKHRLT